MQRFLILAAVLYLTFIGGTAYSTNNLILRIVLHVLVSLAVGGWLLNLIRKRRSWPRTPFDLPLLAFVLLLWVTTLDSQNGRVSLEQSWPFWMHLIWFYMLVDVMQQGRQRWVFEALFMAAGVFVIISIVEVVSWYLGTGFAGFKQGWFEIGGFSDPIPPQRIEISLALNLSTIVGNYAALLLPVLFAWSMTVRQADNRFGLRIVCLAFVGVLLGAQSRGSFVAVIGASGVLTTFWMLRQKRLSKIFSPRLLFSALIAAIIGLGVLVLLFATRSTNTSDQRRIDMWESAITMAQNDPFTGVGVFQFGTEYRTLRDKTLIQDKLVAAHNLWLNTAAETGVFGLLILGWLGGLFLKIWWKTWQQEGQGRKIRLEGILAALVGFCLHSLIDTFTLSASVLPILIYTAYLVAGEYTPYHRAKLPASSALLPYHWVRYATLLVTVAFFIWLMRLDVAGLRYMNGLVQMSKDNHEQALDYFQQAESLDPRLGIYDLQIANLLGHMAQENPEKYLDAAIQAHQTTLTDNPTFDLGYLNLAALYAEKGDFEQAVFYSQKAVEIHPDTWQHWLKLAEYQEKTGENSAALDSYREAVELNPLITASDYWFDKEGILETLYPNWTPAIQTLVAMNRGWTDRALDSASRIEPQNYWDYRALITFAFSQENYPLALQWATEAIEKNVGNLGYFYAERAEINYRLGVETQAEKDARTAIFISSVDGARGYYVLALLLEDSEPEKSINNYLVQSAPPMVSLQEYAAAVYARPAQLNFLPQLRLPGLGRSAYDGWFWLAERYAADDNSKTKPEDVYDAIADRDPYIALAATDS